MSLFVLGLDGATFSILDPLLEEGFLPNIKSLISEGAKGPLNTIIPPVTAPAWLALGTGLNPGKTGVFDYINRTDVQQNIWSPISSANYRDKAIWDYLSREGFKVGIFNYPTLYPPPAINGFSVSGISASGSQSICFPAELGPTLDQITDGFENILDLRNPDYEKDISLFFTDIRRIFNKQKLAIQYLVREKEWDFFFAVLSFTDWMQHVLWKYLDKDHPLHDPSSSKAVKSEFRKIWHEIDSFIGDIISTLPRNSIFIIVSDHGAGPLDSAFYPNSWLEEKGWLKKNDLGWKRIFFDRLNILNFQPQNRITKKALHHFKTKVLKISTSVDLIDTHRSLAYSPEHNVMYGCLILTEAGRETGGFKELLLDELRKLAEEIEGIDRVDVFLPENIYSGPKTHLAPDIFFMINDHRTSFELELDEAPFKPFPSLDLRSGGHAAEGVFLATGSIVENVVIENISLLDVAPTILYMLDQPIPSSMDGRVITECIKKDYLKAHDIRMTDDFSPDEASKKDGGNDINEMKKMLKSLGYM